MYDASGVRLHAGKQASVLNMIITELPPDHPVSNSAGVLKDTLGHTPLQVGPRGTPGRLPALHRRVCCTAAGALGACKALHRAPARRLQAGCCCGGVSQHGARRRKHAWAVQK